MSTVGNFMSNILDTLTYFSSPPCAITKTLQLSGEDQCVLCALSAWIRHHIFHPEFLSTKNQVWNSEGLIKVCGWHQGL